MSEIPTPFKILSAITAGTLVGCSVAEAITPIPTEQAKNIAGTLELASAEIGDNFWNTQVIYGNLNPLDKEGLTKQDLTCLNIEINKANFDFCTFESRDGTRENWWIKSPEGWIELQKNIKSGYNMDGKVIDVATWVLGNENVIWYPQNQDDWLKDSQNPNFGITFLPPSVFGENPIQGYDKSSGLGIKIPLNQVENDPFSQENIFQAIAYRTRFQIGGITPTLVQPTETPTPSPESLLPPEVKEKFELAGVDLANMQNAKYDKDGLHITLPGGEVIVLTNEQLQKGMYNGQDNVLQYRDEANQNAVYAFDKETGKWEVKVEQIDISNPENFRTVEWDYLTSPAYLAELEQKEKAGLLPKIPENVSYVKEGFVNYKPDDDTSSEMIQSYGNGPIFTLSNDIVYLDINKRPFVLVDICKTEIEGVPMIFFTQMWKNSDGSHAFNSHFLPDSKTVRTELDYYINGNYNGKNYGYQAGAFFVKDSKHGDGFDYYMNILTDKGTDSSKLKTYYYENVEMFLSPDIYKSWGETGILKNSNTVLVSPFGLDAIQN